jgi:hypothetical protein
VLTHLPAASSNYTTIGEVCQAAQVALCFQHIAVPDFQTMALTSNLKENAEMKLLGINFTKESSLLLHAIHSLFYWRIFKKNILFFGF